MEKQTIKIFTTKPVVLWICPDDIGADNITYNSTDVCRGYSYPSELEDGEISLPLGTIITEAWIDGKFLHFEYDGAPFKCRYENYKDYFTEFSITKFADFKQVQTLKAELDRLQDSIDHLENENNYFMLNDIKK